MDLALSDDRARTADYGYGPGEVDLGDAPRVSKERALKAVALVLSGARIQAFGQTAEWWHRQLDEDDSPSAIHATANDLLQEMDPYELEYEGWA